MAREDTLGCGQYRILIQRRCQKGFVCEMKDVSDLSWSRVLNDTSEATVSVAIDGECCTCLSQVNPWEHELVVFRDGVQVWVGPVIDMTLNLSDQTAEIQAKDLSAWLDHRLIEIANVDYEPDAADLADVFDWLVNHAYCKDPWCMQWSFDPIGIPVERYYPSFDRAGGDRWGGRYDVVGDEIRQLSNAGVDWTVVNRFMYGGNVQIATPHPNSAIILDSHLQRSPMIRVAGSKMTNRQVVAGGQGGFDGYYDDQIYISPASSLGQITPTLLDSIQLKYGLLESFTVNSSLDEVDTTKVPNAVQQEAGGRYELLHQPYVSINQLSFGQNAPVTMNQLVPGATLRVYLTSVCRTIPVTEYRIKRVSVSVSDTEDVSVDLEPVGIEGLSST